MPSQGLFTSEQMDKLLTEMSTAESNHSHLNKLVAATMCDEIEEILRKMRVCADDMPHRWPEFAALAAEIRGYAFNAFRITSNMAIRDLKATSPQAVPSIDDLL